MIRKHTRKPYPERSLELYFVEDDDKKSVIGAGICGMEKLGMVRNN